ncbi:MAG: twin-arginine translocase TatA/TatE family subunit [Clostridium sp.]|nr:twin-arginine translocase TatA/TatE family subunit [Clostridium sp.]
MTLLFILGLKGPQLIFIALIILLVFGAGRIPNIMRSLGKGIHSFRQGIEDAKEEINKDVVKHDAPKDGEGRSL